VFSIGGLNLGWGLESLRLCSVVDSARYILTYDVTLLRTARANHRVALCNKHVVKVTAIHHQVQYSHKYDTTVILRLRLLAADDIIILCYT